MLDRTLDWFGRHPFWTMVIFTVAFFGGLALAFYLGIVDSHTKLMPY